MEERISELKIGSKDDVLTNASETKILTLKSLEKDTNLKFEKLEKYIKFLETRINIINKSLRK